MEETGLVVGELKTGPHTNDFFPNEDKHYITLFMIAKYKTGEPINTEPEKCEGYKILSFILRHRAPLYIIILNIIFHHSFHWPLARHDIIYASYINNITTHYNS